MALRVACQMDPIERIDIRGDTTFAILLEAQKRGPRTLLLHAAQPRAPRQQAACARRDAEGRGQGRRALQAQRAARRGPVAAGRGAAAAGPALRHGLHHHDALAGAHPSQDAGRQRPRERA